jgi:hypothetical protein
MSNDNDKLLTTYTRIYRDNNVSNNYLYMYILLTKPISYLFWLYFSIFNIINIPFIYKLILDNSGIENIIYFFCAVYVSDFISGLNHIYLDNSKVKYTETINDFLKIGFKVHHVYPTFQWSCYNNFQPYYEANTLFLFNIIISIINVFTVNLLILHFVLYLTLIMQMNHYWCHSIITKKKVPYIIYKLQDIGILLNYKTHSKHHKTYDNSFCLLTGWNNKLFDYIFHNKYLLNIIVDSLDYFYN